MEDQNLISISINMNLQKQNDLYSLKWSWKEQDYAWMSNLHITFQLCYDTDAHPGKIEHEQEQQEMSVYAPSSINKVQMKWQV